MHRFVKVALIVGGIASLTAAPNLAQAEEASAGAAEGYPTAIIDRPLTLPAGVWQASLSTSTIELLDEYFTILSIGGAYGVTDEIEVAAAYAFPLLVPDPADDFDVGSGSIAIGGGYAFMRGGAGGKLELVGRAATGISLADGADNPLPFNLGVQAQYNVTSKIAIVAPGDQLSIAVAGDVKPISFGLPVGVGFQATPNIYAQVDTQLLTLAINDDAGDTQIIFADATPLALSAFFSPSNALDVGASVGFDLTPPDPLGVGDTLAFGVIAAYRGGL